MARKVHRLSIFSQTLDRVAFTAYFLGAVVPLAALAVAAQRYVLPALEEGPATKGLVASLIGVGVLSLGSFLILRRVTRETLRKTNADNRRLATLLEISGSLVTAPHCEAVDELVARCSAALTDARAAFVVRSKGDGAPLGLTATAGDDALALYDTLRTPIDSLAKLCATNGRPALVNDGKKAAAGGGPALTAGAAAPFTQEAGTGGAILVIHTDRGRAFDTAQIGSLSTLAGLASVALHKVDLEEAQKNFFAHMTDILVTALDAQLDLQSGHSRRVAHFATVMGRELGFDETRLERLHFAGLLHDVGMLKVDAELRASKKACRAHTQMGHRMLARIRLWEPIAPFVLHHHEWWNGEGYPEGLAGEDIPLEARIIGIAEAFDSMTSPTSYKSPVPVAQALEEIRSCAGTQFDPEAARLFLDLVDRGVVQIEVEQQ